MLNFYKKINVLQYFIKFNFFCCKFYFKNIFLLFKYFIYYIIKLYKVDKIIIKIFFENYI